MYKVKTFKKSKTFTDANGGQHVILVYGELTKTNHLDGIVVSKVRYVAGDERIIEHTGEPVFVNTRDSYSSIKKFNFGWAICDPRDNYDEAYGIELCKKRFGRNPLTTQEGKFLTDDMIEAILENEINFLKNEKLLPLLDKKKYEAPKFGFNKEVREALEKRRENDAVAEYVKKKVEEKSAYKDGDILKITWNSGKVSFGAYHSVDKNAGTVTFYWITTSEWGTDRNHKFAHFSAPYTESVSKITNVVKAQRSEVVSVEKLLEDKFNKIWDYKKKLLLVKNRDKIRSVLDFFC